MRFVFISSAWSICHSHDRKKKKVPTDYDRMIDKNVFDEDRRLKGKCVSCCLEILHQPSHGLYADTGFDCTGFDGKNRRVYNLQAF